MPVVPASKDQGNKPQRSSKNKLGRLGKIAPLVAPVFLPPLVRRMDRRRKGGWEGEDYTSPPGVEMHTVSADGTPLHLLVHGEGDRVVFLVHGWICNHTIFRYQQQYFKDRYKVVSLDLRGHGRSGIPSSLDYHPDRLAEDLKAAVDLIDPARFVLAGHSMGGFTILRFFARFGQEYRGRLKGLAIIDSSGLPLVDGLILGGLLDLLYPRPLDYILKLVGRHGRLADALRERIKNTSLAYLVVRWGAFGKRPAADEVELVREMVLNTPAASASLAAKACIDFDNVEVLSRLDLPVLLLVGAHDKLTNREVNQKTIALLPDARLVVYPDAGHCALLESREEFNADLKAFLEQVLA